MTLGNPGISLSIGGAIDALDLPFGNLGIEVMPEGAAFQSFMAKRGVPGSSGTTTIQLELNGSPVSGATLSWTSADAAFADKSVTGLSVFVDEGDRLSLRVTSAEVGAEDIYAKVV